MIRLPEAFVIGGYVWTIGPGDHPGEKRARCDALGIEVDSCDGVDGLATLAHGVLADLAAGKLRPHGAP